MRIAVTDPRGHELAAGRDLAALKKLGKDGEVEPDSAEWKLAQARWEKAGVVGWEFEALPESLAVGFGAAAFPGLASSGGGFSVRLFRSREEALESHRQAIETILLQKFAKDVKYMERHIVLASELQKIALFFGGKPAIEKTLLERLRAEVLRRDVRSGVELRAYAEGVVRALFEKGQALVQSAEAVLESYQKARAAIDGIAKGNPASKTLASLSGGLKDELEALAPKDVFASRTLESLSRLPRYLEALAARAARVPIDPEKDRKKAELIDPWTAVAGKIAKRTPSRLSVRLAAALAEFREWIEEYKVAVFAPELKTIVPVSPKRLGILLREIEAILAEEAPPAPPVTQTVRTKRK